MSLESIDLIWLLTGDFFLCFLGVALFRGNDRFWQPCLILWILIFSVFLMGRVLNRDQVSYEQLMLSQKDGVTEEGYVVNSPELEAAKKKTADFNNKMIHLLGLQSFLTLIWMALGYRVTGLNLYAKGMASFAFFTILYIIWWLVF